MTATRKRAPSQADLTQAVAHPLRAEILTILCKRTASPSEIAIELGAKLHDASYHVRRLVELNCAELVKEERVRGWPKSLYRSTTRNISSEEIMAAMHPAIADHYVGHAWREIAKSVKRASESGSLDPQGPLEMSCTELTVDAESYREILEILERAREEAQDEEADSAGRVSEGADERFPISVSLLCFRLPQPKSSS